MNDKRKRAAPTIDLTATEVSSASAASDSPPPPQDTAAPPKAQMPPHDEAPPEQPTESSGAGVVAAVIAGGAAGAVIIAAVFAALWFSGVLAPQPTKSNGAQIASLQKQIHDLRNRPPPATDTQALDALRTRVAGIEHDIAQLPPGDKTIAERLAVTDNAMKALGIALTALNHRSDDIAAQAAQAQRNAAAAEKTASELRTSVQTAAKQASVAIDPAQLDALQKRVAALQASVTAARAQIANSSTIDTAARLALSAASLREAVESGAPYAAQLALVKSLGADDKLLAPLAMFAAGGVPSQTTLAHELTGLMPALLKAAGAQNAPAGFLARLQANADKLVRISPMNAPTGDNPSSVLARIEVEAAQADIGAALADLDKLPAPARAPAKEWIARVKGRQAALAAARQIAATAARSLDRR